MKKLTPEDCKTSALGRIYLNDYIRLFQQRLGIPFTVARRILEEQRDMHFELLRKGIGFELLDTCTFSVQEYPTDETFCTATQTTKKRVTTKYVKMRRHNKLRLLFKRES